MNDGLNQMTKLVKEHGVYNLMLKTKRPAMHFDIGDSCDGKAVEMCPVTEGQPMDEDGPMTEMATSSGQAPVFPGRAML